MSKIEVAVTEAEEPRLTRSLDCARDDVLVTRDDVLLTRSLDCARDDVLVTRDDETVYQNELGISLGIIAWTSAGKEFGQLWESGVTQVVHNIWVLSTKLSTRFSTAVAENYSTIHRLYYYNYFN